MAFLICIFPSGPPSARPETKNSISQVVLGRFCRFKIPNICLRWNWIASQGHYIISHDNLHVSNMADTWDQNTVNNTSRWLARRLCWFRKLFSDFAEFCAAVSELLSIHCWPQVKNVCVVGHKSDTFCVAGIFAYVQWNVKCFCTPGDTGGFSCFI